MTPNSLDLTETSQSFYFILLAYSSPPKGSFQKSDGLIIGAAIDRVRVAVLATMGKAIGCRVP